MHLREERRGGGRGGVLEEEGKLGEDEVVMGVGEDEGERVPMKGLIG